MKAVVCHKGIDYISGYYQPNKQNEQKPQCTWAFNHNSGEIKDLTETTSVVIGYAKTNEEAIKFLER